VVEPQTGVGFEPTYKELKQLTTAGQLTDLTSFEPTYKELKPPKMSGSTFTGSSFEPTYKELKQPSFQPLLYEKFQFRAYLQGIETTYPNTPSPHYL